MLRHKRQFRLFVTVILLPAAVLVGLTLTLVRQERELTLKRAEDERTNALEQLRRELTSRLEAIKLQEINRRIRGPYEGAESSSDPAILFVTEIDGDHIVLPWASQLKPAPPTPQYVALRQQGESLEFRGKDPDAAVAVYQDALKAARAARSKEECEARLLIGRALVKSERLSEAATTYSQLLSKCGSPVVDDEGIPIALYAAARMLELGFESVRVKDYLFREIQTTPWLPPPQAYMIRSLLQAAGGSETERPLARLNAQIADMERIVDLVADFSRVWQRMEPSVWFPFGSEPWLISIAPAAPPLPALLFAVSSERVAPPGTRLVTGQVPASFLLGEPFPDLRLEWRPARTFSGGRGMLPEVYLAGVVLIFGATSLVGYLLIRDVNRDLRLAEMRSHFVASVSHELKTPLTAIRMFAETLVLGRCTDQQTNSEYLSTIMNESERLARLVDNVLDFSKIEQGKRIYRLAPTLLEDVVRSSARTMQYPLSQQGFTLKVTVDDSVPPLLLDADAMEQAILNLLINAMKYSGGARQIDLGLYCFDSEAVVEVNDRGLGIAREDQARIFEKFYRVRSPETEYIAGAGLGLTLVHHIAQAHGGRVELRSALGEGSTFSIRIPIKPTEASA